MLSIKPIGSSSEAVGYYAALGQEDYYTGSEEPPGVWWGAGAAKLGLEGRVAGEVLRNVLLGVSPDGQTNLVRNAKDPNRRAAFDLTWSVPKSVSAAWSQADEATQRAIEAAGERAVYRTLDVFAEECGVTRRGRGGTIQQRAGLLAAVFRHDTARGVPGEAPDAQLHWHVVLPNVVTREDGSTGAFDARGLFRQDMKMMLGALFRAELSNELESLGFKTYRPTRPRGDGLVSWFELRAVPQELIDALSKRRQEIERWLRKQGASGAKLAELAALRTRRSKENWSRRELRAAWRELGGRFQFGERQVVDAMDRRQRPEIDRNAEADEAVSRALRRITDTHARFSEVTLCRFAAEDAQARGIGIVDVRLAVERAINESPEILKLTSPNGELNLTTREMYYEVESPMLALAEQQRFATQRRVSSAIVADVLREYPTLRREQSEAVRHVTTGSDLSCVVGVAGSGKTFALRVARECWQRAGSTVLGTTLSAKASQVLEEGSGISSVHLHRLFDDLRRQRRELPDVLVVDEAGMVDTRMMKRIVELTAGRTKLVLVGDHKQLQAIGAGSPFRGIADRVGCVEMNQIVRQREQWQRTAVRQFRDGDAAAALRAYHERGLLVIANDREEAMERLTKEWSAEASKHLNDIAIFAGTNLEVRMLNQLCQRQRMVAGELSSEAMEVNGYELHVGDRVLFRKNHAGWFLRNGTLATVIGMDTTTQAISVRLNEGIVVEIDTTTYRDVDLGYALTGHKGQGVTVDKFSFVLTGGPMTDREMTYVQGSRGREMTKFYTDVVTGGPTIAELSKQMEKSRAKSLAHDYDLDSA